MNIQTTSIIDLPKKANEQDLLGIDKYKNGLVKFIEHTRTPITIAIQGEWGSGKTSLMNTLKNELCEDDKNFIPIWLNTWQYSLMKSPNEALISIIRGLTEEVLDIVGNEKSELSKKVRSVFGNVIKATTKIAVQATTGQDVGEVLDAMGTNKETTILSLRDELNKAVKDILSKKNKKGFVFFIDDLDRIDPPIAVQILELLKNIFDLEDCIFVLAIDYDVVIKGLKPKFGELTEKNEREFRSFFDKIIQLPFTMPIASYLIDQFLIDSLKRIGYIDDDVLNNQEYLNSLSTIANLSVGTNPRALKRLANTLSLINIINSEESNGQKQEDYISLLNFAFVCIQISYPYVYNQLTKEPDFINWDNDIAQKLKLKKLTEEEESSLNSTEEFDEEWEKVLYRMCQKETFLSTRVFQISTLLNKIKTIIPEDKNLDECVKDVMELSAVTNIEAFDKQIVKELNNNNVLHSFKNKFFPYFKTSKSDEITGFSQHGARIVKNLTIKIDFDKGFNGIIAFAPRIKDGKFMLWIGSWGFSITNGQSKDFDACLKEKGIYDKYKELMTELDKEFSSIKEIERFEAKPKTVKFGDDFLAQQTFWFGLNFNNETELLSNEGIAKVANITNKAAIWMKKIKEIGI